MRIPANNLHLQRSSGKARLQAGTSSWLGVELRIMNQIKPNQTETTQSTTGKDTIKQNTTDTEREREREREEERPRNKKQHHNTERRRQKQSRAHRQTDRAENRIHPPWLGGTASGNCTFRIQKTRSRSVFRSAKLDFSRTLST